jgi:hypothetical protein
MLLNLRKKAVEPRPSRKSCKNCSIGKILARSKTRPPFQRPFFGSPFAWIERVRERWALVNRKNCVRNRVNRDDAGALRLYRDSEPSKPAAGRATGLSPGDGSADAHRSGCAPSALVSRVRWCRVLPRVPVAYGFFAPINQSLWRQPPYRREMRC